MEDKTAEIRKLFFEHWEECKNLMLSINQIDLLCLINDCGLIRSSELAEYKTISIQSASGRLLLLHKMGYLKRTEEDDPTGGKIFAYELSDDLTKNDHVSSEGCWCDPKVDGGIIIHNKPH